MPPAARSSSTSGTAGARSPRSMADQAGRLAYAHGSAFTTEPIEAYAREVARYLPVDDPAIYPVSGGSEAIETALKLARAYHIARGETERWIVYAPLGELPRQHPWRARPVGPPSRCAGRTRAGSAGSGTCRPPTRIARTRPGRMPSAMPSELAAELDRAFEAAGPDTVAAFVAEPIVGATLAAVGPARWLLAGHRRGLPAAWRPADRRRGHDRVRPDRPLVRARPLGGPAGHPRRRQGGVVWVLAVRLRGGVG